MCDKSLLKPSLLLLMYFFLIQLNYRITQIYGKGLLFYLCAKRMINNYLKTTDQYLQKIISNKIHYFLLADRITNPNQSGLGAPGSCINQLLTITYEKFEALDCNLSLEVESVFLDTSKAFGKV